MQHEYLRSQGYENKNKHTWNHYLSNTTAGPDSSNRIYCNKAWCYLHSGNFISRDSVRSVLQQQDQQWATNDKFVHFCEMNFVTQRGMVSISLVFRAAQRGGG